MISSWRVSVSFRYIDMENTVERWKAVVGYDSFGDFLEVSDIGRVRTKTTTRNFLRGGKPGTIDIAGRVLKTHVGTHGYLEAHPKLGDRRPKFTVHRMVARAFVPGFVDGLTVNHINGIKTDNRAENLEWVTLARNTQLQWEDGLVDLRGNRHPNRKLHSGQVRIIRRLLKIGATNGEMATLTGVSSGLISMIQDGKRWGSVT